MRKPDENEQLAESYLRKLDLGDVQYEPEGNKTPDYAVGNRIAVEVRLMVSPSLNPNEMIAHEAALRDVIREINLQYKGKHRFTHLEINYPYPTIKTFKRELRTILNNIDNIQSDTWITICKNARIQIPFFEPSSDCPRIIYGITSSNDMCGFACEMTCRAIKFSIDDKNEKAKKRDDRYKEWWLILINSIPFGPPLPDEYKHYDKTIRETSNGLWNKVIILERSNGSVIYECLL